MRSAQTRSSTSLGEVEREQTQQEVRAAAVGHRRGAAAQRDADLPQHSFGSADRVRSERLARGGLGGDRGLIV